MSWRCWNTIIIICSHPVFPNRLHIRQRTEKKLSPKTGWISWLHFKKCQAPAAPLSVGNAGALRIRSSCQLFSAVDLSFGSFFRQNTVPLLFWVIIMETCGCSLPTSNMGLDRVIEPLGKDINWVLCVYGLQELSDLNTFLLFPVYFPQKPECGRICVTMSSPSTKPGLARLKNYFQFSVMTLLQTAVYAVRFEPSGGVPDCSSQPEQVSEVYPSKSFYVPQSRTVPWSLFSGCGRANGTSSLTD